MEATVGGVACDSVVGTVSQSALRTLSLWRRLCLRTTNLQPACFLLSLKLWPWYPVPEHLLISVHTAVLNLYLDPGAEALDRPFPPILLIQNNC